jgi:hypothetical protein
MDSLEFGDFAQMAVFQTHRPENLGNLEILNPNIIRA